MTALHPDSSSHTPTPAVRLSVNSPSEKVRHFILNSCWDDAGLMIMRGDVRGSTTHNPEEIINYRPAPGALSNFHLMCLLGAKRSLIEVVLRRGADIKAVAHDDQGQSGTCLHFAMYGRHYDLAKYLSERHPELLTIKNLSGESPFLLLYADPSGKVERSLVEPLLKDCSIDQEASPGDSALTRTLAHHARAETLELVFRGARLDALRPNQRAYVGSLIGQQLLFISVGRSADKWQNLSLWLDKIEALRNSIGSEFVAQIINYRRPRDQFSLIHAVSAYAAPTELVEKILALGADIAALTTVETKDHGILAECNAWHLALRNKNYAIAQLLCRAKINTGARDSADNNGLHCLYHRLEPISNLEIIETLVAEGVCHGTPNSKKETFVSLAIRSADAPALLRLSAELDARKLIERKECDQLYMLSQVLANEKVRRYLPQAADLLEQRQNIEDVFDYFESLAGTKPQHIARHKNRFREMLPTLLNNYRAGSVNEVALLVERLCMRGDWKNHQHPYEAELLCLLGHPEFDQGADPELYRPLERALCAIGGLGEFSDMEIRRRRIQNWLRIGQLTFIPEQWAHDLRPVPGDITRKGSSAGIPSLLQSSKLFSELRAHPSDQFFGPSYVVSQDTLNRRSYYESDRAGRISARKLEVSTWIEIREPFMLVAHAEHGALLVRNSTSERGMKYFGHPAYWSPAKGPNWAIRLQNAQGLTPELMLRHFYPMLSKEVHTAPGIDEHLDFLTRQLIGTREIYLSWRFDTTPSLAVQETDFINVMHGTYNSEGYSAFLTHLIRHEELRRGKGGELFKLGFVSREMAPFYFHPFRGRNDSEKRHLVLTPEVLDGLKALRDNSWNDQILERTALRSFIQEAGLKRGGFLVVIPPRGDASQALSREAMKV